MRNLFIRFLYFIGRRCDSLSEFFYCLSVDIRYFQNKIYDLAYNPNKKEKINDTN
jgi:hypothetical protein